jgi:DNA-binding CsgD family transcriptional regulator
MRATLTPAQPGAMTTTPLIGRTAELARLASVLATTPSAVVIDGEAGVGKSRLARAAAEASSTRPVAVVRCYEQAEQFPLLPVVDLLRHLEPRLRGARLSPLAGALRPLCPEFSDWLPEQVDTGDAATNRHQLFRAVREALAASGPLTLVLDDVQWLDVRTAEFLDFLLANPLPTVAIVATCRSDPPGAPPAALGWLARLPSDVPVDHLALHPLDRVQVSELVASMLEVDTISAEFNDFMHAQTGGLPLAVEELVRLALQQGDLVHGPHGWSRRTLRDIHVPARLRDAIRQRAAALDDSATRWAQALAVLAHPVPESVLVGMVVTDPQDRDGLAAALASGIVIEVDEDHLGLRHGLTRQVIYEDLSPSTRRDLHRRAANVLRTRPGIAAVEVAEHYRAAGSRPEWLAWAELAGDAALAVHDGGTACRIYAQMLHDDTLTGEHRIEVALKFGKFAFWADSLEDAAQLLADVIQQAVVPRVRGQLRYLRGITLFPTNQVEEACQELELALTELGDSEYATQALGRLAYPYRLGVPLEKHLEWLREAEQRLPPDHLATRLRLAGHRGVALTEAGLCTAEEVLASLHYEVQSASSGDEPWQRYVISACANAADAAAHIGDYAAVTTFADAWAEARKDAWFPLPPCNIVTSSLFREWRHGAWADAATRALEFAQRDGQADTILLSRIVTAAYAESRAGTSASNDALQSAMEAVWPTGQIPVYLLGAEVQAACALVQEDFSTLLKVTQHTFDSVSTKHAWGWAGPILLPHVAALLTDGDREGAAHAVEAVAAGIVDRNAPDALVGVAAARALLAAATDPVERDRSFAAAATAFATTERPLQHAMLAWTWAGEVRAHDPNAAVARLLDAMHLFHALGATWFEDQARRKLRTWGTQPPRRHGGGQRPYGDVLSPREHEVVALVAGGLTNRQVADALCLSHRTIEHHVATAMRKLNVGRRNKLEDALSKIR